MKSALHILFILLFISCAKTDNDLTVMTFNIRLDNPNDGEYWWENRKQNLVAWIQDKRPDLIGFQEVLKNQLDYLSTQLPEYEWVGVGRDDGMDRGEFSPVFYLRERLKASAVSTIWLSETPDTVSIGWDAALPRIATILKFTQPETGFSFQLTNTHFDHVGVQARKNSLNLIKTYCDTIPLPLILIGDFNFAKGSDTYNHLMSWNWVKDASSLLSDPDSLHFTFNNFNPEIKRGDIIDFIFYTPSVKAISAEIHYFRGMLLSDHHPVTAVFKTER